MRVRRPRAKSVEGASVTNGGVLGFRLREVLMQFSFRQLFAISDFPVPRACWLVHPEN